MIDLIGFWCIALALVGATVMYFVQWWKDRKLGKLFASIGSLMLVMLVLLVTVPDTYDRMYSRYMTETGMCYVIDNGAKARDIDVYLNGVPYETRDRPDIPFGPGVEYECTITFTQELKTLVNYELRSEDGDVLFSTY
ncbi:hypothetical protein EVJ33_04730 [Exiguobacterium sp. SL-10]|uniref:hypothetical protein n=1 Tax=unclassified Exiguobacterium TaxID=2644629 RepID=UPI00103C7E36|nr:MULTISPECIES: hypothetical protein [unclassified Exiguobacterium]TCI22974.1 hypothetical protein EVJ34_00740 [Exiguobacterium sp. SL-9]TCI30611.1 hypothetical protein EVJ33_04730 [Exiguobacterium sp. SL-10]